jgi:hypothetical protein
MQTTDPSNIWEILDRNNRFKATIIVNFSTGDMIRIISGFTEYVSFQINPLVSVFLCLVLFSYRIMKLQPPTFTIPGKEKPLSSIHLSLNQPKGEAN